MPLCTFLFVPQIASHSLPVAVMAGTSKKCSALLHDQELECLLQSDAEQNLSDSDFDTENELEDHALLDTMGSDGSDEDGDRATQDFIWEDMENYRGQWENFMGSAGAQGTAKHVTDIVDILHCFSKRTY
jgi:hypothetical protein